MKFFKTDVLEKKRQALAVFNQVSEELDEFIVEAQEEVSSKEEEINRLRQEIAEEQANIDVLNSEMNHAEKVITNIQNITS